MTEKIKKILGWTIITSLVVLTISVVFFAYSYSRTVESSSLRSFSVNGQGKIVAIPDIAKFNFSIITEGGVNISDLQKENTKKIQNVLSFIKESGVKNKDIKTTSYVVSPRYQYYNCRNTNVDLSTGTPCPPAKIVGYTIRQSVSVKVRDFEKVGDMLVGVTKNGANKVSGISFEIDNLDAIQNEARKSAIEKAKKKARDIAKSGEFKMGKLISINESAGQFYQYGANISETMFSKSGSAPPVEPGSQDVTVNVTMRYEIK